MGSQSWPINLVQDLHWSTDHSIIKFVLGKEGQNTWVANDRSVSAFEEVGKTLSGFIVKLSLIPASF